MSFRSLLFDEDAENYSSECCRCIDWQQINRPMPSK
jgi:hypothetical protein